MGQNDSRVRAHAILLWIRCFNLEGDILISLVGQLHGASDLLFELKWEFEIRGLDFEKPYAAHDPRSRLTTESSKVLRSFLTKIDGDRVIISVFIAVGRAVEISSRVVKGWWWGP